MPDPDDSSRPRAELPTLIDFAVLRRLPTRWGDNDIYGHVNNVVYYALFDSAVNGWLTEVCGVGVWTLPAIGVVAETSCRYLSELTFPDEVAVGIALEHRGRTSVVYRLGIFRVGDDGAVEPTLRASGRFVHVYVDAITRRPVPIPPEIGRALDTLGQASA